MTNDTVIYLIRHAHKCQNVQYLFNPDYITDKCRPLSVRGMQESLSIASLEFLKEVDSIYSSEYSRCIMTAMYLSEKVCCPIVVDASFNERLRRVSMNDEMPDNFRLLQMKDENYKTKTGESRKEVCDRFNKGINEILEHNKHQTVAVFTHKTAITMFLMQWCRYTIREDVKLYFKNREIFSGNWNGSPEIFKLVFNGSILVQIEKVSNKI